MEKNRYNAAKQILDNHKNYNIKEVIMALRFMVKNRSTVYIEAIILTGPLYPKDVVLEAIKLCKGFNCDTLHKLMKPIFNYPETYDLEHISEAVYIAIDNKCVELVSKVVLNDKFPEYARKHASEFLFNDKKPKREDYETDKHFAIMAQSIKKHEPKSTEKYIFTKDYKNNEQETYELINNLELGLRLCIEEKLSSLSTQWWKQRIPKDVQDNAEARKKDNEKPWPWFESGEYSLIHYCDFNDYLKIILKKDNWNGVFKNVFIEKKIIETKLKELDPIRNAVAHFRKLNDNEKTKLRLYTSEILSAIKRTDDSDS